MNARVPSFTCVLGSSITSAIRLLGIRDSQTVRSLVAGAEDFTVRFCGAATRFR
jgi:hypothetical protein